MADIEKLIFQVSDALSKRTETPSKEELCNIIAGYAGVLGMVEPPPFTEDEKETALLKLQVSFDTRMSLGTWFFDQEGWTPWWLGDAGRKVQTKAYYWERYQKSLLTKSPPLVVGSIDTITDKILDHLEDPQKGGRWERKGLVVGHVQSGKTANYIGLISKAADAGYKVIIVLGGTINSLRNQTQARIDSDFFGYCTKNKREIGVARFGIEHRPFSLTTSVVDFAKATADKVQIDLNALREPVVFVLKKNVTTLKNVKTWLESGNKRGLSAFPLLLIDDEADHASINTNKENQDPTRINLGIRELLRLFPRNSYVGYTATPFANIFIDPDNEDQMQNGDTYKDLFPRDFILSLDPPSNYVGAEMIFGETSDSRNLRIIDDNEDFIPLRHEKDWISPALPPSLRKAMDCFILAKTIRELRGQTGKHHSMMVNVSRFTNVQEQLKVKVAEFFKIQQQAIKNYAGLTEAEALNASSVLRELKIVWELEYADAGFKWIEVQHRLNAAASPIAVVSINNKSTDRLDYADYPDGRSLIAIGGLGLSRGLTLEGLSVSYFLRNSIMYDTLLQMGRWFGYREGYQDLCRIFMTWEAMSWYSHISESVEELRGEFREMERLGLTPMDFGLKVRSHPTALIVTAKNKMRSATEFVREIALDGRFAETSRLINNDQTFADNKKAFEDIVAKASKAKPPEQTKLGWLWKGVPIEILEEVVENFKNAPDCLLTTKAPLHEHIRWLKTGKGIAICDILLRGADLSNAEKLTVCGLEIKPITRSLENRTLNTQESRRLTFIKRHIISRGDEAAGLSGTEIEQINRTYPNRNIPDTEYRKFKSKNGYPPLLILVFAEVSASEQVEADGKRKRKKIGESKIVPAYGISFPGDPSGLKRPEKTVSYIVNSTWLKENSEFPDNDEMEEDEE
jgi:hypothetical protein